MIRMTSNNLDSAKERLIKGLQSRGYLQSKQVERALRAVPREEFVLPENRERAYQDHPLPISHGQTISAPHMCVIMCEALDLKPGMKILEVGAGSGYHAALTAEIVGADGKGHVYTVEIVANLIDFAEKNLKRTGYADRVTLIHGDGGKGLEEHAPFDRIFVAAAAPSIPEPLLEQLAPGGTMLIPVGSRGFYQELIMVSKSLDNEITKRRWGGVAFVPLTGEFGF